jgi:F-type H+-transporting ATPase subunit a
MDIQIAAEKLSSIGSVAVSNSFVMVWIVAAILILASRLIFGKLSLVPGGAQNAAEMAFETLLQNMQNILGSREKAVKYFPFIATLFILILTSNWLGLLPGVGSIGFWHTAENGAKFLVPYFRSPSSDLNFTLGLAIMTVISVNAMGIRSTGWKLYIKRYINFSSPINFFVGMLEIVGELAKIVSLSFRLFGNVFAGEVLLIIMGVLAPYLIPIPFVGMELFAGFIQALVFSTLALVFLSLLTESHEH